MNTPLNYLVIGSGSIARRHIENIKKLFGNVQVSCVSASGRTLSLDETGADLNYRTIDDALQGNPSLAIVASPAPFHVAHAAQLLKVGIPVLVEKPLSNSLDTFAEHGHLLQTCRDKVDVAYNLRFMPAAIQLKALLEKHVLGHIYRVTIDVGQYLPDWRPTSDYRKNVSAQKKLGGGVLLELSHELDYLTWLFGTFDTAYCVALTSGSLEVDVEDGAYAILSRKDGLVATLHMEFLQRVPVRTCKIVGASGTLIWDLLHNRLCLYTPNGEEQVLCNDPGYDRNSMYLDELARFVKVAAGELEPAVDIFQALDVMKLIEALKYSADTQQAVAIGDYNS